MLTGGGGVTPPWVLSEVDPLHKFQAPSEKSMKLCAYTCTRGEDREGIIPTLSFRLFDHPKHILYRKNIVMNIL